MLALMVRLRPHSKHSAQTGDWQWSACLRQIRTLFTLCCALLMAVQCSKLCRLQLKLCRPRMKHYIPAENDWYNAF